MRRLAKRKQQREPTIALINIVFLMLVFFMVAGTLSPPLEQGVNLIETKNLDGQAPDGALVIFADGRAMFDGAEQPDIGQMVESLPIEARKVFKILPDRALPAQTLIAITRTLREAGIQKVILVSERAIQ